MEPRWTSTRCDCETSVVWRLRGVRHLSVVTSGRVLPTAQTHVTDVGQRHLLDDHLKTRLARWPQRAHVGAAVHRVHVHRPVLPHTTHTCRPHTHPSSQRAGPIHTRVLNLQAPYIPEFSTFNQLHRLLAKSIVKFFHFSSSFLDYTTARRLLPGDYCQRTVNVSGVNTLKNKIENWFLKSWLCTTGLSMSHWVPRPVSSWVPVIIGSYTVVVHKSVTWRQCTVGEDLPWAINYKPRYILSEISTKLETKL